MSEDARFCRHRGVDWDALRDVSWTIDEDGPSRGASTITMQTAKNLFLWPSRSYVRKGMEIPLALALDAVWPKRRIIEVYLNIAEWGAGHFRRRGGGAALFRQAAPPRSPRARRRCWRPPCRTRSKRDPRKPERRHTSGSPRGSRARGQGGPPAGLPAALKLAGQVRRPGLAHAAVFVV